jgi:drug/metabolite transporter (DMT)-like permease
MIPIIFWTIVFSISGTATTVLLGDRNILSGNLLSINKFISIIFHWKFILAIICSFFARYSFMLVNNSLLKIPNLAQNSTTITAFITSVGIIFMIAANYIFLGEKINFQQGIGALFIMIGVFIIFK